MYVMGGGGGQEKDEGGGLGGRWKREGGGGGITHPSLALAQLFFTVQNDMLWYFTIPASMQQLDKEAPKR